MDRRSAIIELLIKDFDLGADTAELVASQQGRLIIQKAIYLLQAMGIKLGYRYNWYVRGPYSPRLTKDYYHLQDLLVSGHTVPDGASLKYPVSEDKIRQLFGNTHELDMAEWLELTASLAYLLRDGGLSFENAAQQLREQKTHLFEDQPDGGLALIEQAYAELMQAGVVPILQD